MEDKDVIIIRKARKSFAAIGVSYFMGLFNDNFYKEAAVLIAVASGKEDMQAVAMGFFTLCYILFAAPAGWMADKYSKGNVIIGAKVIEMAAMVAGAFGMWTGNWWMILAMIGLMGAQSAVFSPAMNGSIPELYPKFYVPRANAIIKLISTVGIFSGMIFAGHFLDMKGSIYGIDTGRYYVGVAVLIAAAIGLIISFGAPRIKAAGTDEGFPYSGPVNSFRELIRIRKDRLLFLTVIANLFIWSLAAVMTMLVVNLGKTELGLTNSKVIFMKVIFMSGIAVGGFLSNRLVKEDLWYRVLYPGISVISLALLLFPAVTFIGVSETLLFNILLGVCGIAGGVLMIPLASFLQTRPEPDHKGRVIAAANFSMFLTMTAGAGVLYLFNALFIPSVSFSILGLIAMIFGLVLSFNIKKFEKNIQ